MSEESAKPERSLRSLWLIAVVCVAPLLASYIAYYFWQPSGHVNHGELLEPRPVPDTPLTLADGAAFEWSSLRGKWVLMTADAGACGTFCQQKLVYMRQVRLAQGKETDRIERVWLVTDDVPPAAALVAQHQGVWLAHAAGAPVLKWLPVAGSLADHIYVIDPLGNLMMRYPRDADPRRMVKDVARLLKHSQWK
jgi:cytochrome oxidase Cu insertion factor (SCO1/SenC/PrrC family)